MVETKDAIPTPKSDIYMNRTEIRFIFLLSHRLAPIWRQQQRPDRQEAPVRRCVRVTVKRMPAHPLLLDVGVGIIVHARRVHLLRIWALDAGQYNKTKINKRIENETGRWGMTYGSGHETTGELNAEEDVEKCNYSPIVVIPCSHTHTHTHAHTQTQTYTHTRIRTNKFTTDFK